jgi:hypothetical protein
VTPWMRMTVAEFACLLGTPEYPARIHPITEHGNTSPGEPCIDHMPGDGSLKIIPDRCYATEDGGPMGWALLIESMTRISPAPLTTLTAIVCPPDAPTACHPDHGRRQTLRLRVSAISEG